jgi:alkylation response protein AidB-like acyl-CoA dehydrogenase
MHLQLTAGEHLRRRYLPEICAGRLKSAFALSEPDTGSDASGIKTRAVRDGNGYRLTGQKLYISAAHVADTLPGRPAGEGYGLSVRVVTNHAARNTLLSDGTYGWSGAQGTHFFVDPKEQLVGVLMVQTPNNVMSRDFEDLVAQAIVD